MTRQKEYSKAPTIIFCALLICASVALMWHSSRVVASYKIPSYSIVKKSRLVTSLARGSEVSGDFEGTMLKKANLTKTELTDRLSHEADRLLLVKLTEYEHYYISCAEDDFTVFVSVGKAFNALAGTSGIFGTTQKFSPLINVCNDHLAKTGALKQYEALGFVGKVPPAVARSYVQSPQTIWFDDRDWAEKYVDLMPSNEASYLSCDLGTGGIRSFDGWGALLPDTPVPGTDTFYLHQKVQQKCDKAHKLYSNKHSDA